MILRNRISKPSMGEFATRERAWDWMGNFGYLPDPDPVLSKMGEDIRVYRSLLSDAHVWSCFTSRTGATLSREWRLEPAKNGKRSANRKAREAFETVLKNLNPYRLMTDMLYAPFFGMSPIEIVWAKKDGLWTPAKAEGKPPEWFVYSQNNEPRFLSRNQMLEGEPLPELKYLIPRHFPSYLNPYGERILSRCFWPVAFKRGGMKFWAVFAEKYGMPWAIGKVPRNTGDAERSRILSQLAGMVQDAVAVINDDESVDLIGMGQAKAASDVYSGLISVSNREISKAVLGQTLTTEIDKGGSYAASQTHLDIRADLAGMDQKMVSQEINTLCRWFTRLNFAGAESAEFLFFEEEDIQADRAERDKKLYDQGVRFSKKYYVRAYGFEDSDIEEGETIAEPEKAPENANPEVAPEMPVNPEFAEGEGELPEAWKEIDGIGELAAAETEKEIRKMLAAFGETETLEEIAGKIGEIQMPERVRELIARAKFFTGLAGYVSAKEEAA